MRFHSSLGGRQAVVIVAVMVVFSLAVPAQVASDGGKRVVKVLTYNVNEGTDFLEVMGAQSFPDFIDAVQLTLNNVRATNPPLRAQGLAREIAQAQPDLVGLQEVSTWITIDENGPVVEYDFLQLILDELAKQGQHYQLVNAQREFELGAPATLTLDKFVDVINFDVILARTDLPAGVLKVSNPQSANFSVPLPVPTALGQVDILRGWASVDVDANGKQFRFVTTHFEDGTVGPGPAFIQMLEAFELLSGPATTALPVVLAGDFNARANLSGDPTHQTYDIIVGAGEFADAWMAVNPATLGFTCCQDPDSLNPVSKLTYRIDLVFTRGNLRVLGASLVGEKTADRVGGLWPSDHAGVRAELQLQ